MFKDKVGQRAGASVIIGIAGVDSYRHTVWICRCDCGNVFNRRNAQVIAKRKKGYCPDCAQKRRAKKHYKSGTTEYRSWNSMMERCRNPKYPGFDNYGGRGIRVCERWHDFRNFLADMGDKPKPAYTLEREDVDGMYTPENCHWATRKEQQRNRRVTTYVTYEGIRMPLTEAAEKYGTVSHNTARGRLNRGFSVIEALTLPVARPGQRL